MKHFDAWDTRFAFFWYNDQEIFHDTDADLARKAEAFARVGINHVITFSATHFRWSFRRHWELLTETLARVVTACHAAGIRVTEHHSSHLTHNPVDQAGERQVEQRLRKRGSSLASWPHLREDCDADPVIDGVRPSSWRQVDGRTGRWARSAYPGRYDYQGWAFCFNNPHYRRAYLAYLERLYAIGIDGIMTDDVEWFGAGHACACTTCPRLVPGADRPRSARNPGPLGSAGTETMAIGPTSPGCGSARPRPRHFTRRSQTTTAGSASTRCDPTTASGCCTGIPTGYRWKTCLTSTGSSRRTTTPPLSATRGAGWAIEAAHRFAVGRWRGIPPMSMFYPDRPDTVRFCWALAMSWGHLYLATPEGRSLEHAEKRLRRFEVAHPALLRRVHRVASVGFYDSRATRELYEHAEERSVAGLIAWAQACYRRNLPFDLFQQEELDRLPLYRVVVLNEAVFLSDAELAALRGFVRAGGTLVWTGATGSRDESGAARDAGALARFWGIESFAEVPDGAPPVTTGVGAGRLVRVAGDYVLGPVERIARPAAAGREARLPWQPVPAAHERLRDELVAFLAGLAGGADLELQHLPADVLATVFATERGDSLAIHLVNAARTLAVPDGAPVLPDHQGGLVGVQGDPGQERSIGHDDPIPFPRFAGEAVRVAVRLPAALAGRSVRQALYHDPDVSAARPVVVAAAAGRITAALDPAWIGVYGLLQIELD